MPSPFPGMNPYLEQPTSWHDFHEQFIMDCRGQITPQLPEPFIAKLDEHVYQIDLVFEVERENFIEIRDWETQRLVTVIEVLSPSNKRLGPDREQFLNKRAKLIKSDVHYVEIDLLRGGPRLPVRNLPESDYYVLVSRSEDRPDVQIWPLQMRDRLPVISIPLSSLSEAAVLDLQQALHRAYDSAGYADYIYDDSPEPPLSAEDAHWAEQLLKQANR